jgi:CelD/BcsL family acetyltransferase involved in cellulose biosynthesis
MFRAAADMLRGANVLTGRPVELGPVVVVATNVERLTSVELAEWSTLFAAQPGAANPFLSPTWIVGWYRHYTVEADRHLFFIRHRVTQQLLGVAPFYAQNVGLAGLPIARRLLTVGSGATDLVLEVSGVLLDPAYVRDVLRALTAATLGCEAHWCETTFAPEHGWFEPEWVFETGGAVSFYEQRRSRACVILQLSESWEQTRAGLKRNVKESIRRSQNRLKKDGRSWRIRHLEFDALDVDAVDRLLTLHRARAAAPQAGVHHPDAFTSPLSRSFLRKLLPELSRRGAASIFELQLDGETRASQLALHAPGCSYVYASGFDPELWQLGPVTLLHAELIKHAVTRGDRFVNFSPGPNVSKLRWSERLWVANDFAYGAGGSSLRLRYGVFLTASVLRNHARAIAFAGRNARGTTLPPPARECVQEVGEPPTLSELHS